MDQQAEETELCPNCKRDIPQVNFLVHTVHCARNICICPTCKEPVPNADLQHHYDHMHKLNPCKKCGEQVCGSDLEDHVRDSCAHTIRPCRFCSLELARSELPAHEGYCGVRTEQCPECREYVMIKYRQLHLDSNHGFIKLDDEIEYPMLAKLKAKPANGTAATTSKQPNGTINDQAKPSIQNQPKNTAASYSNIPAPNRTVINYFTNSNDSSTSGSGLPGGSAGLDGAERQRGGSSVVPKRTNDKPQVNTAVAGNSKNSSQSHGAIKKRPAPKPPSNPVRDLAFYSALSRHQQEERARREQNQYNIAHGLPPVLTAAEKVEKLRKMDALHNREEQPDYKDKLRGRCWNQSDVSNGERLGTTSGSGAGLPMRANVADLSNLQPMSQEEFFNRFRELQMSPQAAPLPDRFVEIRSSLRELRRGLTAATAPYCVPARTCGGNCSASCGCNRREQPPPPPPPPSSSHHTHHQNGDEVRLPCEFCDMPVLAEDLVQHQTGCRPDLTQLRPSRSPSPRRSPVPVPAATVRTTPTPDPVIPCEFCTESLPVYLITEHQERCRQEAERILYPD